MQRCCHAPFSNRLIGFFDQDLFMQSWMKNQRSSPVRPCFFTSVRQALSLGLLAAQVAFISFSFCIVSFILPGLASVVAGVAAGAGAVWAEAMWKLQARSSTAARRNTVHLRVY